MTTILLSAIIYYFIGIGYSYEVYKKYDRLEFIDSPIQGLYIAFIFTPLWILHYLRPKFRRMKEYAKMKRNQYQNVLPQHKIKI